MEREEQPGHERAKSLAAHAPGDRPDEPGAPDVQAEIGQPESERRAAPQVPVANEGQRRDRPQLLQLKAPHPPGPFAHEEPRPFCQRHRREAPDVTEIVADEIAAERVTVGEQCRHRDDSQQHVGPTCREKSVGSLGLHAPPSLARRSAAEKEIPRRIREIASD